MGYTELFDCIDRLNDKYIRVWENVCNIESPTRDKEGIDRVGSCFADAAKDLGFEVEILPMEKSGDVVIITMNSHSSEKAVVMSGHIDTVHEKGIFGSPAVHFEDGKIIGPGVVDCKGGVVAALMAMEALKNTGFTERPIKLMLQTDEEVGSSLSGKKTINTICEKAKDCEAFLNLEGCSTGKCVVERKGILRMTVTVHGKACHSAACYDGANAVIEAAKKILKLEEMKDRDGITCNCGVIHGGTVANTVADKCEFTVDIRFKTSQQLDWMKNYVRELCQVSETEGCYSEITKESVRPSMEKTKENCSLLKRMNKIYSECGLCELEASAGLGGSDAAYTTMCGIPTVDSIGVLGGKIHTVEEFAYTESLGECAKRLASVAYGI